MSKVPEVDETWVDAKNASGDTEMRLKRIKFRCSCGRPHESVVYPWTPLVAKFHCRHCDRIIEVKTRESAWDPIEGAMEEGAHTEKMKKRTSVQIAQTRFGKAALIN